MDKQSTVVFRNVGQLYFPQTRVECHYSLTPDHEWSSSDWIGIFEVDSPTLEAYLRTETQKHHCFNKNKCGLKKVFVILPQVGWTSVKQYYTYTWALVPEGYTEGTNVNCCVLFQGKKHLKEHDAVNNSIDLLDILSVPRVADGWVHHP